MWKYCIWTNCLCKFRSLEEQNKNFNSFKIFGLTGRHDRGYFAHYFHFRYHFRVCIFLHIAPNASATCLLILSEKNCSKSHLIRMLKGNLIFSYLIILQTICYFRVCIPIFWSFLKRFWSNKSSEIFFKTPTACKVTPACSKHCK